MSLSRDDAVGVLDHVYGLREWDYRVDVDGKDWADLLVEFGVEHVTSDEQERAQLHAAIGLVTTPFVRPKRARVSTPATRAQAILRAERALRKHAPYLLAENAPSGVRCPAGQYLPSDTGGCCACGQSRSAHKVGQR